MPLDRRRSVLVLLLLLLLLGAGGYAFGLVGGGDEPESVATSDDVRPPAAVPAVPAPTDPGVPAVPAVPADPMAPGVTDAGGSTGSTGGSGTGGSVGAVGAPAPAAPVGGLVVESVSIDCVGDTVSGKVVVRAPAATQLQAQLWRGPTPWGPTAVKQGLTVAAGRGTYPYAVDVAAVSASAFQVQLFDRTGARVARSSSISASSCAPGSEVPEVPVAVLVPLTMLATAGVASALGRRQRLRGGAAAV